MSKKDIVEGYKGIMDLDLTDVDPKYKKIMTAQHLKDIDNYKGEQAQLKPHLRYENTIGKVQKIHEKDAYHLHKRTIESEEEKRKYFEKS
jgi:hypothetical protein